MADIIRLNRDPHRVTQHLLPWYVTGALDAEDTAVVEAHLESCAECRAELETDRALGAMMAAVPSDAEFGWAALKNRIGSEASRQRVGARRGPRAPNRRPSASRWPVAMPSRGWAAAAQVAGLILIVGIGWISTNRPQPEYHALSTPKAVDTGNVVVIFKPTISEQDMRGVLRGANARLVDGPTASDAYVLHVADEGRAATLRKLRANAQVVLAEPIDGDGHP